MMKRFYIFMLLALSWLGAEAKNEPYAALSNNNKTLTFYYDELVAGTDTVLKTKF